MRDFSRRHQTALPVGFAQEFVKGFEERSIGQAVDRTVIDSAAAAPGRGGCGAVGHARIQRGHVHQPSVAILILAHRQPRKTAAANHSGEDIRNGHHGWARPIRNKLNNLEGFAAIATRALSFALSDNIRRR
jgi:hypothetical protein